MKCLVLVKKVPDTEISGNAILKGDVSFVINPYDEHAIEEALQLTKSGGEVTYLTVGDKSSEDILRKALAMGGDKAVRIDVPADKSVDSLATAKIISEAIKTLEYDLILAGKQSVDSDSASVTSMIAEYLNIPQVTFIKKLELSDGKIVCHRDIDEGTEVSEVSLPALVSCDKGLNKPRFASVMGIMKAKKKPVDVKSLADLGLDSEEEMLFGKSLDTSNLTVPTTEREAVKIESEDPAEAADEIIKFLKEKAKVV